MYIYKIYIYIIYIYPIVHYSHIIGIATSPFLHATVGQDLHLQNLAVAELVSAALLGATVGALCGQAGWFHSHGGSPKITWMIRWVTHILWETSRKVAQNFRLFFFNLY